MSIAHTGGSASDIRADILSGGRPLVASADLRLHGNRTDGTADGETTLRPSREKEMPMIDVVIWSDIV
jgi:hypothetical protein